MKQKKIIFLLLALLLPIVVFIFLKSFGKNEFVVQPLFQDSVMAPNDCASLKYTAPYSISDTALFKLKWGVGDSLTLFVFDDSKANHRKANAIQISRIFTELSFNQLRYLTNSEYLNNGKDLQNIIVVELPGTEFSTFKNCIFLLKPSDNAVLIDAKGKIRGQYDLTDLEGADRLIMEMKIILKQF